ncbi:MAG: EAL domain-containing response regulator [Gammaproteobacteria bacterium]|nr:EAL domain-containing response regulator [Gammaproteobacteria bacterium]
MNKSKRLIVIDDDIQFAGLLGEIARSAGFETELCDDARDYFLANEAYSVMVLDLNMPGMDGVEVIRQLGKTAQDIHLILISGYDKGVLHSAEKLAQEHNLNVVGSLTKPLEMASFISMLNSIDIEKSFPVYLVESENSPITVAEIRQAIVNNEMELYYQPQIELRTNTLKGVEALVRWHHPTRGLITPGMFISIVEKEGLMGELTSSIINMAVNQSNEWKKTGLNITISVNVSAENITSLLLPEQLSDLIKDHGLNPQSIVLEITERALMGELKTSLDILTRLRMKGFGLSIDDFGTGNSSLVLLHRVPFTELKIDMSFVKNMDRDLDARAIVETCVMLSHKLNMDCVAEGVENESIRRGLTLMGCDIGQGYLMAKPMAASQLIEWIENNNYPISKDW